MTLPDSTRPQQSSQSALRIFAVVVALVTACTFVSLVTEQFHQDVWRALAYALLGIATTGYWAGIAFLNTARFRAARARISSPGRFSFARAIAVLLIVVGYYTAWYVTPDAYQGMLLLAFIAVGFAIVECLSLRRRPLT